MKASVVVALSVVLTGCMVGPNYSRPKVDVPTTYRGPDSAPTDPANTESLGDAKWWTVFQDPELQKLIRTGLEKNFDIRIAATRILEAQSQVTITRSAQFPSVSGAVGDTGTRTPQIASGVPSYQYSAIEVLLSASWTIDFWGKYRRATEASRALLLQSEWARRAVTATLVANVASAYFQLRELDLELEISQRTLASRQDSLKLTQTLSNAGSVSLIDVRQAEQLVETASAVIPDFERQIQQEENQINILLGQNPGTVVRGLALTDQAIPVKVPPGIPSRLLERRPDIHQAEQQLIANNAQIGVARAALFPEISLTGTGGVESIALTTLFRGPSGAWSYTAQAAQPIFTAGRLRANLRLAEAQRDEALLSYEQTIQKAFGDVSNALIGYKKIRDGRVHLELLVTAARSAAELSRLRYQGGATSYLEVLTSDTNAFAAELNLASARLAERIALVQIYNSLGGGWEQ